VIGYMVCSGDEVQNVSSLLYNDDDKGSWWLGRPRFTIL